MPNEDEMRAIIKEVTQRTFENIKELNDEVKSYKRLESRTTDDIKKESRRKADIAEAHLEGKIRYLDYLLKLRA